VPWTEATPMDHRLQFVAEARRTDESFTALCARYGVAPKTGDKWLARYEAERPAGLHERSRRPHTSPTATPPAVAEPLLELRRRHPTWGGPSAGARWCRGGRRVRRRCGPPVCAARRTKRSASRAASLPESRRRRLC
jgi:transposase-like protein